jgi:hypothetical protein
MNRKLGQLIKATLFVLPLALPGVALAQSAGGGDVPPGSSSGSDNGARSTGTSAGTMDNTDKQNAGSQDTGSTSKSDLDRNPPAGSLGTSGSSSTSDRDIGGDVNKPSDSTTTKQKNTKPTENQTPTKDSKSDIDR